VGPAAELARRKLLDIEERGRCEIDYSGIGIRNSYRWYPLCLVAVRHRRAWEVRNL